MQRYQETMMLKRKLLSLVYFHCKPYEDIITNLNSFLKHHGPGGYIFFGNMGQMRSMLPTPAIDAVVIWFRADEAKGTIRNVPVTYS